MLLAIAIAAVCISPPVDGPVVAPYAPSGRYAGHWGIDYAADFGSVVRAPASGTVTFAGSVAGMKTVTVEPVPGLKVSMSYLSEISVTAGQSVRRGQVVGRAAAPHGSPGVHMSTRVDGSYVDPSSQMGCRATDITRALRLVTPPRPYPRGRANRNTRRDLRPDPRSPSPHRRMRFASVGARSRPRHPRR